MTRVYTTTAGYPPVCLTAEPWPTWMFDSLRGRAEHVGTTLGRSGMSCMSSSRGMRLPAFLRGIAAASDSRNARLRGRGR